MTILTTSELEKIIEKEEEEKRKKDWETALRKKAVNLNICPDCGHSPLKSGLDGRYCHKCNSTFEWKGGSYVY